MLADKFVEGAKAAGNELIIHPVSWQANQSLDTE